MKAWTLYAAAAAVVAVGSIGRAQLAYYNAQGTTGTVSATNGPIGSTNFYPTSTAANVTAGPLFANAPFDNPAGNGLTSNALIYSGDATYQPQGSGYQSTDDSNIQFFREDTTNPNYGSLQPNGQPSAASGPSYTLGPNISSTASNYSTSEATAVADGAYVSFTVSPTLHNVMTITSISFDIAQATGTPNLARGFALRSSLDNYASDIAEENIVQGHRKTSTANAEWESFNPDGSVTLVDQTGAITSAADTYIDNQDTASNALFQDITSQVTFRFYFWTQTSGSSLTFNNISVNGFPEPTVVSMAGLAAGVIGIRRRR
ncbi:MAG TPA: hypothetical protein VGG19_01925 [Tepidisphaeraceae bacterium]